jgi:hypothetical protein
LNPTTSQAFNRKDRKGFAKDVKKNALSDPRKHRCFCLSLRSLQTFASFAVKIFRCEAAPEESVSISRSHKQDVLVNYSQLGVLNLASCPIALALTDNFTGRPRVIVISDIGNEPDDQMSLIRFLLYSNEFDIEGLIAATSTWQKNVTHPETMHTLIDAYGQVRPNLLLHAKGWPTAEDLNAHVFTGQPGYGIAATGSDKMSPGAEAIIHAADRRVEALGKRRLTLT